MNIHNFLIKNRLLLITKLFVASIFFCYASVGFVHAQNDGVNGADYAVVTEATSRALDQSDIQTVKIAVKSGKNNNSIFEVPFKAPTGNIKRDLVKGDVVLVSFNNNGNTKTVDIVDFYRVPNIFWAPVLFILLFLVVAIVKYKRKVYIFVGILIAIGLSAAVIIFLKISAILTITVFFSLVFSAVLYFMYRRVFIALIGLIITLLLSALAILLSYITLQLGQIQLSYLSIIGSFYGFENAEFIEAFYAGVLMSCLIGGVYISYNQILESIKIKISYADITKRELTFKSFKHITKTFDQYLFPTIGFLLGIMFSIVIFMQKSIGLEGALNSDYFVSISIIACISLIVWVVSVPVCALLCGVILGRVEKHKVVTDKTVTILD